MDGGNPAIDANADDDELENPCSICLVNEDDYVLPTAELHLGHGGVPLVCFKCGMMVCGECNEFPGRLLADMSTCSQCGTRYERRLDSSRQKDQYRDGWHCLAKHRAPGRHTRVIQYNLGNMALMGFGTAQSVALGMNLLVKSATAGYGAARETLLVIFRGGRYSNSIGLERNPAELERWARDKAEQSGKMQDQYELGQSFAAEYITDVERDCVEAFRWIRLAAAQGHTEAMMWLATPWRHCGDGDCAHHKDLSNFEEEVEWYRKAVEHGNMDAACKLAMAYTRELLTKKGDVDDPEEHRRVSTHLQEALKLYTMAAERGHAEAQYTVAQLHWLGQKPGAKKGTELSRVLRVDYDFDLALELYHKSAENGYAAAKRKLGYIHMYTDSPIRNQAKGAGWFRRAAEENNDDASCFEIGAAYFSGCGVEKAVDVAIRWWSEAASRRHTNAQVALWKAFVSTEDLLKILPKACRKRFLEAFKKWHSCFTPRERLSHDDELALSPEKLFRRCKIAADGYWVQDEFDEYERGDDESVFILGCMHFSGYGTPKNLFEARRYWSHSCYVATFFEVGDDAWWEEEIFQIFENCNETDDLCDNVLHPLTLPLTEPCSWRDRTVRDDWPRDWPTELWTTIPATSRNILECYSLE